MPKRRLLVGVILLLASVLLVSCGITADDDVLNKQSGAEAVTPTPTDALSRDYSKHGFGFDYPASFSVSETGLFDTAANDASGMVTASTSDHSRLFQVTWIGMSPGMWASSGGLDSYMDAYVPALTTGQRFQTTKAGHDMAYQSYSVTNVFGATIKGVMAVFYCEESRNIYQMMTIFDDVSGEAAAVADFMGYLDSFVGH